MGLAGVLFNPIGRIGPKRFWQGIIVLIGAMIVLQVAGSFVPGILSLVLTFLVMPYMYLCVYGKRLHDANQTAAWFILLFLGFVIIMFFALLTLPGWSELFAAVNENPDLANDQEAMEEYVANIMGNTRAGAQLLIAYLGTNALFGFLIGRLTTFPDMNQHGAPEGGIVSSDDEDDFL